MDDLGISCGFPVGLAVGDLRISCRFPVQNEVDVLGPRSTSGRSTSGICRSQKYFWGDLHLGSTSGDRLCFLVLSLGLRVCCLAGWRDFRV